MVFADQGPTIPPVGFVEKHFATLIQNTKNVLPMADILYSQKIISNEQYSNIKATKVDQQRTRELLDAVGFKGEKVEREFLKVLQTHNPNLIESLIRK